MSQSDYPWAELIGDTTILVHTGPIGRASKRDAIARMSADASTRATATHAKATSTRTHTHAKAAGYPKTPAKDNQPSDDTDEVVQLLHLLHSRHVNKP